MTSKHRQIRANSLRAVSLLVSLSIYYSDRLLVFWIANESFLLSNITLQT